MSRFDGGWVEFDPLAEGRWIRNSRVCVTGRRGQVALRQLEAALLSLPEHRLIKGRLATPQGEVCAVGALVAATEAAKLGSSVTEAAIALADAYDDIDDDDDSEWSEQTLDAGAAVGLSRTLALIVGDINDRDWEQTPEERWTRVLRWVRSKIIAELPA